MSLRFRWWVNGPNGLDDLFGFRGEGCFLRVRDKLHLQCCSPLRNPQFRVKRNGVDYTRRDISLVFEIHLMGVAMITGTR